MDTSCLNTPRLPEQLGTSVHWNPVPTAALAHAIVDVASKTRSLCVVTTADMRSAIQLQDATSFFNSKADVNILNFPDWETLPYDYFSPHEAIISQRITTLYALSHATTGILILPVTTLLQRIAPVDFLQQHCFILKNGDRFEIQLIRKQLDNAGYRNVPEVNEHGEYAIRGSIFDVYPMGAKLPLRIDCFDNEVDSIRSFDPETQKSIGKVEEINILPAKEFPFDEQAITLFRQQWREQFSGNPVACPVYEDVSQHQCPAGIEYYLPLFFEQTATLFDYFPENTLFINHAAIHTTAEQFWVDLKLRHQQYCHDRTRPLLSAEQLYLRTEQVFEKISQYRKIIVSEQGNSGIDLGIRPLPDITIDHELDPPLTKLAQFIKSNNQPVLFCAESLGRRQALIDLLATINIQPQLIENWHEFIDRKPQYGIIIGEIQTSFAVDDFIVIAENQLFSTTIMQKRRRSVSHDTSQVVRDLSELKLGSPVVHIDHGVGRYQGLQTLNVGGKTTEFLTLTYADNAKLYVPITSLHLISRYSGTDLENAPLHYLGNPAWEKEKRKAAEKIRDAAAELLDIYARRASKKGFQFQLNKADYIKFTNEFPYEETPDQQRSIDQVIEDMTSCKMMDRLVCGDVGFGKTEVAMRAAFIAVNNAKQVAMLVPTTLLAQQHFATLQNRFAHWPVNIACLSRFQSKKECDHTLQLLEEGKLDIVVGTHKLLQEYIVFKNLGLLIIDEEHRFGVRQKDKIKSLRSEVDILALTATPIPRTLNMSLSGVRDLSIITTPPAKRLSIKTFILERNTQLIKEAIMRELSRGGQVFFVHNRVESIEKTARELQEIIPEARITIAHGQMHERELERVMSDFYHVRFNVLVCTTIIENGIDIPTANTVIIDRADLFGLAQLHQIRGRVGRSHHQAYAYLLTPGKKLMTADGLKRLEAFSNLGDLGIGFTLATHDLEIRGAGELLGDEQSGHIHNIGFTLYMELLDETVKAIKSGKTPSLELPLKTSTEVDIGIPTVIPETYLNDIPCRLMLYKRIANAQTISELDELQVEMIDRFGLLPQATKNLFAVTELRLQAQQLGIRSVEVGDKGGKIEFLSETKVKPETVIKLIQSKPAEFRFDGAERLRFSTQTTEANRIETVQKLLQQLGA